MAGAMVVPDLLDDGSWTLAYSLRLRYDAARLAQDTRDLVLTYRSHRFRAVRGGSGVREDGFAPLRQLLQFTASGALCDACLALACAVSLAAMRALTDALIHCEPQNFERAAACTSCGRSVPSVAHK